MRLVFWQRWRAGLDPHFDEVIGGTWVSLVFRVLGRGLTLAFNLVLARLLGAEGAGAYFLALSVSAIGVVVSSLGLPNVLLRLGAVHASRGDWPPVAGLRRQGLRLAGSVSAVVTAAVFLAAPWIAERIFSDPGLTVPLRLMSFTIVPATFLRLHAELLRGLQRIRDSLLAELVGVPLISLAFLALIGSAWKASGAAAAYLAGTVLSLVWGVWLWRRATPQLGGVRGQFDLATLARGSMPLFAAALTGLVMAWADTLLLGIWLDSQAVGLYGIGVRVSHVIASILVVVSTATAPKFAALHAQRARADLGRLVRRATLVATVFALPLALLFWVFPRPILGLFGAEFRAAALVLMILTTGQFVNVAAGSVGNLLMMTGHEKDYRNIAIGSAALNLLLNLALIPRYGIEGAAVATASSVVVMNIACVIQVYRRLGIVSLPLVKSGSSR